MAKAVAKSKKIAAKSKPSGPGRAKRAAGCARKALKKAPAKVRKPRQSLPPRLP